jgi:DNA-binding NarL/FixJ family response regulator
MARILIADDNKPFRTFLKTLLERHDDWSVCGVAKNGDEARFDIARY